MELNEGTLKDFLDRYEAGYDVKDTGKSFPIIRYNTYICQCSIMGCMSAQKDQPAYLQLEIRPASTHFDIGQGRGISVFKYFKS